MRTCERDGHDRLLRIYGSAPGAFWRHDVDVSLDSAAKMARFEKVAGVLSTYYVMLRGEFYNPFSPAGEARLLEIVRLGHTVGLHVDVPAGTDPEVAVMRDQELAQVAYPNLIDASRVSFHMPHEDVLWRDFPGFFNAYSRRWEGKYVADSRGEFPSEKEQLISELHDAGLVQVNLHPEWWMDATTPDAEVQTCV